MLSGTFRGSFSPLLFILLSEAFASKIRQDSKIEGLEVDGEEFKLKSYADDVILKFGSFSGYKINREKMKIIPKSLAKQEEKNI